MCIKRYKKGILGYRIFSRAYFHLPFLTVYLYILGYSIILISMIMASYGMSVCVFSIIERRIKMIQCMQAKYSLIGSEVVKIFGLLMFVLWKGQFVAIVIGQLFLGIGYGMAAGKDTLLIKQNIKDDDFQARSNAYMFFSVLCAGLAGSILFNMQPLYPFVGSIFVSVIAIIYCCFLPSQENEISINRRSSANVKEALKKVEKLSVLRYSFLRGIILTLFSGFLPVYFWQDLRLTALKIIIILSMYTLTGRLSSQYILKYFQKNDIEIGKILDGLLLLALILFYNGQIYLPIIILGIVSGMVRPACIVPIRKEVAFSVVAKMEVYYSVINLFLLLVGGVLYQYLSFKVLLLLFLCVWLLYFNVITMVKKMDVQVKRDEKVSE